MEQIEQYAIIIAQVLGYLTIGATIIVRLTPSKKDDEDVGKITSVIWKYIGYLPTLGINPRTKKLEEAYLEAKNSE